MSAALPGTPLPFLLRYMRLRLTRFLFVLAIITGAAACAVGVQYGMKLIVDAMSATDRATAAVWAPLGLFIGLLVLESFLWRIGGWFGSALVIATGVGVRLDLFEHLSGHSMRFFDAHLSGALGNRITAAAGSIGLIFGALTWSILPPIIDFIGAVVVLLTIDGRMALALVGFVALVAVMVLKVGARGRALHQRFAEEGARVNGELVDTVANIWTVKAFAARSRERDRLAAVFGMEADAQRASWRHVEKTRALHDLCLWLMAGSMLVWAVLRWRASGITTGDVVVISALTFRILHGSRDLAFALVGTAQQFGALAETLRVVTSPHTVGDPARALPLDAVRGEIEMDAVTYRYPDSRPVFQDFSLRIPAGQRLGIVGESGAGKSTLLALLQRLDDVQAGEIRLDGRALGSVTQDALRAQIAVVPQDVTLFHRTVLENIRYGRPGASDAEVRAAAREARCEAFIAELPEGEQTLVGERGVRLSGGQRQRLSIARAFLKDAPVLILDEATAALDSHAEAAIHQALHRLMRGRTVLAVAHRLSTISGFDRIVMLANGRIVEDGTPTELLRRRGAFHALWHAQALALEQQPGADSPRSSSTGNDALDASARRSR